MGCSYKITDCVLGVTGKPIGCSELHKLLWELKTIMLKTKQIIESWLVSFRGKFKSPLKHSMGAIPYFELKIYDSGQLVQKNQLSLTGD